MYTIQDLNVRLLSELKEIAEELGLDNYKKLPKKELIYKILDFQASKPDDDTPLEDETTESTVEAPRTHRDHKKKKLSIKRENVKKPEEQRPE